MHKLNSSITKLERQYQTYNSQAKEQLQSLEGIQQQLPQYEKLVLECAVLQSTLEDKRSVCAKLQVCN